MQLEPIGMGSSRILRPTLVRGVDGRVGMNPAYASFLPNGLHSIEGIATNVSTMGMVSGALGKRRIGIPRGSRITPDTGNHTSLRRVLV